MGEVRSWSVIACSTDDMEMVIARVYGVGGAFGLIERALLRSSVCLGVDEKGQRWLESSAREKRY